MQPLHLSRSSLVLQQQARQRPTRLWGRHEQCEGRSHRMPVSAVQKQAEKDRIEKYSPPTELGASLRAEAEAPFRTFRLALFGAGTISAGLATLFSLPQLAATIAQTSNAKSWGELGTDLAINLGALAICAYLVRSDLQARDKQIARLTREEKLGSLQLELANGRVLRLAQLRSFARVIMVAGTPHQVEAAIAAAEPFKKALQERGVLVLGLPFVKGPVGEQAEELPSEWRPTAEDLRWRATPMRLGDWAAWFQEQARLANAPLDRGLYVALRLDGRVRGSGTGCPPWQVISVQLPPMDGFFGGLWDGMDGKVL